MADIIKIKQDAARAEDGAKSTQAGAGWFMGSEWMRPIGKADARRLCGMYPTPGMGCECVVAVAADKQWPVSVRHRLSVQNISGGYWLACCSVRVSDWADVFKVEIVGGA